MGAGRFAWARPAAALALLAVAAGVAPAGGAATAVGCENRQVLEDDWIRIEKPPFADTRATMTAYDSADRDVGALVATSGTEVFTTRDGGCDWTAGTLPAETSSGLGVGETRIVSRNLSSVRFAELSSNVVWVLGQSDVVTEGLQTNQPRVLRSNDSGKTFADRSVGLPRFGRPVAVRGFGSDLAFLLFKETLPREVYRLFGTSDGGATWDTVWEDAGTELSDFVVDFTTMRIWAWHAGGNGVHVGSLSAAPTRVPAIGGPVRTVDLGLSVDGRSEVAVYLASGGERYVSTDRGTTFRRLAAPEGIKSVSSTLVVPGLRVISSLQADVLVEPPNRPAVDFSPNDANVGDVQFVHAYVPGGFPLYAFNALAIYHRVVPPNFLPPPPPAEPPVDPIDVKVRDVRPVLKDPFIRPVNPVVRLRPGQRKTVDFQVGLPPVPTPLDVYFMTDSTRSMRTAIAGVQDGIQDIIEGIAATGTDLQVGVADFRDHPGPGAGDSDSYPYKQRREVGPIDLDLAEALESITTGGGSVDGHDSALEATYQAVTGAGRKDPLVVRDWLIQPGQDAGFRPNAMRVVVLMSDDDMRHPENSPGYPGPSMSTVTDALRDHGVLFVGIQVATNSGNPRADMERLARASGAVAPPAGVDCDGDDVDDVGAGEPIVCDFDSKAGDSMAAAFLGMLRGIKDLADAGVTVTGPKSVVRTKGELSFPQINVREEHRFTVPVEFRCTDATAGDVTPVGVALHARGQELLSTTATVRCIAPAEPVEEVPPAAAVPPLVAAALAPPPPPPPAPVTNVQPNPHPNPNPNPQLNPNAGFASQEDQQFQLALAQNEGVQWDEELAMSGLDRSGPPVPALAWAAAFAMTGAAAFGLRHARKNAHALAYNPSERR